MRIDVAFTRFLKTANQFKKGLLPSQKKKKIRSNLTGKKGVAGKAIGTGRKTQISKIFTFFFFLPEFD